MFDFLKKKITSFTNKLKEKIQKGPSEEPKEKVKEEASPQTEEPAREPIQEQVEATTKKPEHEEPIIKKEHEPEKTIEEPKEELPDTEQVPEEPTPEPDTPRPNEEEPVIEEAEEEKPIIEETEAEEVPVEEPQPEKEEYDIAGEEKSAEEKVKEIRGEEKRKLKAKVGLGKKLFGFIGGKIKIGEKETEEFFDEFELSLLEADVEQETSEAIVAELKGRLVGKEISAKEDVSEFLKKEVKASLETIMKTDKVNVLGLANEKKPLKILFLGPNGAGKTTTIAKAAHFFMNNNKSVIMAAGDTFRAAAIDQLEEHGKKLGVKVIKHNYGSDPTAVAFDAVKAAEAKGIDVVLIDSAGRQDTNKNLLEELKKMERVIKPDLKLYVGEAYTGQALLTQAKEFNEAIGIHGFVLTKIDTDVKGGTAISLLHNLKKPIVFVGTGQRYEDLLEFKPEFILDRIL